MTNSRTAEAGIPNEDPSSPPHYRLKYSGDNAFHAELRRRADEYFRRTGKRERDCWQMYFKTAIIMMSFTLLYVALVFLAGTWWQALPIAIMLGFAGAAIGLNIQHDASHNAYSDRPWMNRLMSMSLDLIGGSSHLWRGKHVLSHHTYTNIAGHDGDIDLGILGRIAPHDRKLGIHRWQHYYLWPVYGFMTLKWQLYDDFWEVGTGKIRGRDYPRPKGWILVTFIVGKLAFLLLALGIPLTRHPLPTVILFFGVSSIVMGLSLAVIFQLAHAVAQADFPLPAKESGKIEKPWAVSQVECTVDFARRSRVLAWLLGGINFQIEHHLFSRVCHIHYPALSAIVEDACKDFGIRYAEHRTFWAGITAHYRWLKRMSLEKSAA